MACDVCSDTVATSKGYLLTTSQVVKSPKYWRYYYKQHKGELKAFGIQSYEQFCLDTEVGAACREAIVAQSTPWLICSNCIGKFSIKESKARDYARRWWESGQKFQPKGTGPASLSNVVTTETVGERESRKKIANNKESKSGTEKAEAVTCNHCGSESIGDEFCLHCGAIRSEGAWVGFTVLAALCFIVTALGVVFIPHGLIRGIVAWTAGTLGATCSFVPLTVLVSSARRAYWYNTRPDAKELTAGNTGRVCYRCHQEILDGVQCPFCGCIEWEVTTSWMLFGWLVVFGGCLAFQNVEMTFFRYLFGAVGVAVGGLAILIPITDIAAAWKKSLAHSSSRAAHNTPETNTTNGQHDASTRPDQAQYRDLALEALGKGEHGKAAAGFLRAVQVDPQDASSVTHCGVACWLAVKVYLKLIGPGTIQSCRSGAADELVLTYLMLPKQFPGGVFASQVREAVPENELKRIAGTVRAAEQCFRRGYQLGDKGGGLLWLVALLRGTGRFQQCRQVVDQAAQDSSVPREELNECQEWADGISAYEADFKWLKEATEGWVIPKQDRLLSAALNAVVPTASQVLKLFTPS